MTVSAHAPLTSPRAAAIPARLWPALAASAAAHCLLALGVATEMPPRHAMESGAKPIVARIEPWSGLVPGDNPAADEFEGATRPRRIERQREAMVAAARTRVGSKETSAAETAFSFPPIPDATVYSARDLDSYPRPLTPLDTRRLDDAIASRPVVVRLEVIIDERGIVSETVVVAPGHSDPAVSELRTVLAATRFIPARKEGRAVKSRVLLEFDLP